MEKNNVMLAAHDEKWELDLCLADYKKPGNACKALHKAIRQLASDFGQDPDEVILIRPEDTWFEYCREGDWGIMWEGGPYEWAYTDYVCGEWGYAEAGYSFTLTFCSN